MYTALESPFSFLFGSTSIHSPLLQTVSEFSLTTTTQHNTNTTVRIWEEFMGAEGQKAKAVWLHVLMGVCMCVYRWPTSQEGAAALLIHGHSVQHWVTDVLEMYITGFLKKVAVSCARVGLTWGNYSFSHNISIWQSMLPSTTMRCWK